MKLVLNLLLVATVSFGDGLRVCQRDDDATCGQTTTGKKQLSYYNSENLNWDETSLDELWHWLKSQLRKDLRTFCVDGDVSTDDASAVDASVSIVGKTTSCDRSTTTFQGSVDVSGFPKGPGVLHRLPENEVKNKPGSKK